MSGEVPGIHKTIGEGRNRIQSEMLTGLVGALLLAKTVGLVWALHHWSQYPRWFWVSCIFSASFALLVWMLRSATGPAAIMGGLICLNLLSNQGFGVPWQQTALPALLTLFLLTFAATRFGRKRKQAMGVAESKRGRQASQILANLGVAGLCAGISSPLFFAACLAALAEATADTVSSEMGQALRGRTLLITNLSEVPAGTDGGISIAGTTLGAASAALVVLVMAATGAVSFEMGIAAFGAGIAGLLFDSLLGATVELKGWLGNDLVNFTSTLFSAATGYAVMLALSR